MGTVLWPDIIKVSCSFTKAQAGGTHGKYQIYWNTPEEPGPYTVQLLAGTQVLEQKLQVYGTGSCLEADIPEKTSCCVTVFPEGKQSRGQIPVPGESVLCLQEIICEESPDGGLCGGLQVRYDVGSIVPGKVTVQLRLPNGGLRLLSLAPFESRVSLRNLGIEDVESIRLGLGCTYQEQSAVIEQETAEDAFVEVGRRAPELTEMWVDICEGVPELVERSDGARSVAVMPADQSAQGHKPYAECRIGLAQEGAGSYTAVLSCAGRKVRLKAGLLEDKRSLSVQVPLAEFPYGAEPGYLLSVLQKDGMVTFPESEKLPVNLQKPVVETLRRVQKDIFRLRLSGQTGMYPQLCRALFKGADGNTESIDFAGNELEHAFASWESVALSWINGKSEGPRTEPFSLKIPAYLSGRDQDDKPFVYYAADGMAQPGGTIRVEVSVKAVLQEQVQSGVFTLSPSAGPGKAGAVLEMADAVWPDHQDYDGEKTKSDWTAFVKAAETAGLDAADLRELRRVAAACLPQKADVGEQAFYRFDMRRRQCGLFPGMSLLVESGRMQWSDDAEGSGYFAGISGAEQVRIPVVCRDGKTGLDAFVWLLKDYAQRFEQPEGENYGGLPGGAGTVDLGREMLRNNHLIVHYPEEFISHCDQGAVRLKKNEYLAAAQSLAVMDRDIRLLESQGYLEDDGEGSQAYVVFLRGRVHMTPCFAFWLEGREYWAAVGTTVGDMMDRFGKSYSLLRDGVRAEIPMMEAQALREICLAPGDCLMPDGNRREDTYVL